MATKTKEKTDDGTQRNLQHLIEEREKLKGAKQEILDRIAKAEERIDVEAAEERRLHEEALRGGRPGQPSKKLKDAEAELTNLKKQLPTVEKLELRLQYEEALMEKTAVEEEKKKASAALAEVNTRLREVTEEQQKAANVAYGLREQSRCWSEAIRHHKNRLLALGDEDTIAEIEAENERNAAMVAGMNDPDYKAKRLQQLDELGGRHHLESPEEEAALREAAAKEGVDLMVGPPSKERGW